MHLNLFHLSFLLILTVEGTLWGVKKSLCLVSNLRVGNHMISGSLVHVVFYFAAALIHHNPTPAATFMQFPSQTNDSSGNR